MVFYTNFYMLSINFVFFILKALIQAKVYENSERESLLALPFYIYNLLYFMNEVVQAVYV